MRRLWWAFLRLFFQLLYSRLAWTYDLVAWAVSLGQWEAWGRTALPHLRGERVLELAHGPGHLLTTMAERGLTPVGLDLSPHMGRQARRRLQEAGLSVPLVRARAQELPFRDDCFDSVVATFPTEFIVARDTLGETARALRPSGRVVIVAWARLGGGGMLARLIRWLYRVTGQGEPPLKEFEPLLIEVGLIPRFVWERVGRSDVRVVVADGCWGSG